MIKSAQDMSTQGATTEDAARCVQHQLRWQLN